MVLLHWDAKANLRFKEVKLYLEARDEADLATWESALQGSAIDQNAVGWALSFGWQKNPVVEYPRSPAVDGALLVRSLCTSGLWVGHHNLGVMLLEGLGGHRDEAAAFLRLKEAASSLAPLSLRRYAEYYRQGIGCVPNQEAADALDTLAAFERVDDEEADDEEADSEEDDNA